MLNISQSKKKEGKKRENISELKSLTNFPQIKRRKRKEEEENTDIILLLNRPVQSSSIHQEEKKGKIKNSKLKSLLSQMTKKAERKQKK